VEQRIKSESSPHVRCVLAETVGRFGDASVALAALTHVLDGDLSGRVKLQALDAMTSLPLQALKAARSTIARAAEIDEYTSDIANFLL
jgi:hypothetical protein